MSRTEGQEPQGMLLLSPNAQAGTQGAPPSALPLLLGRQASNTLFIHHPQPQRHRHKGSRHPNSGTPVVQAPRLLPSFVRHVLPLQTPLFRPFAPSWKP